MKKSNQCPKCGSTNIIDNVKVVDRGDGNWQSDLQLATFRHPDALIFRGQQTTRVTACVCGECGYVELYAKLPETLQLPP